MEQREQLQREALIEMISYNSKLIPAVHTIIDELRSDGEEDTGEFLNEVINGINWEIEVYNQCAGLINAKSNYIDKKTMILAVTNLGQALGSGDDERVAECFEQDFLPFLNKLTLAAKKVVEL